LPDTADAYEWAQRQAYRNGGLETLTHIEIDTSDADMGQRWQDELEALDARIEALLEGHTEPSQAHQHNQGMSY
jgi:hypothetical protein